MELCGECKRSLLKTGFLAYKESDPYLEGVALDGFRFRVPAKAISKALDLSPKEAIEILKEAHKALKLETNRRFYEITPLD